MVKKTNIDFMKTLLKSRLAEQYNSQSQRVRVLTEDWVSEQAYCPSCGKSVTQYENNRPVADFFCQKCNEDYELKSKKQSIGTKIVDGAHRTMLERLTSSNNPNFFLLNYNVSNLEVTNFFVIPKHFFVPEIIEKRKPLAATARRAGWVGCNILLNYIPQKGKIFLVRDGEIEPKEKVLDEWNKTLFLREEKKISAKGWLLDVMRCIDNFGKQEFTLSDVYAFENELCKLHPENKHVKDKIRQQLQILRDKGYLHFLARGKYRLA